MATETTQPKQYLEAFERGLRETNIIIQSIKYPNPIVDLEYATRETEYQRVSDQVGRIAGLFFRQIREGWTATRLGATATVDEGDRLYWYARADWYEQFAAGEITADELTLKVLQTVSRGDS